MWKRITDKPAVFEDIKHILTTYKITFETDIDDNHKYIIEVSTDNLGEIKLLKEMLFSEVER